jgi:hypothetical protein
MTTAENETMRQKAARDLKPALIDVAEKNRWALFPQTGGGWIVQTADCYGDDGQEREIARTRATLAEALADAVEDELPAEWDRLLAERAAKAVV